MGTLKAVAILSGTENVNGAIQFTQQINGPTKVFGKVTGLRPGLHGFHVHAMGDTTNGCLSTGPHYNPLNKEHGAPQDENRHAGDLGNIIAGQDGVAELLIEDSQIPLKGPDSIVGRAVVVHADPDDLGRGLLKCDRFILYRFLKCLTHTSKWPKSMVQLSSLRAGTILHHC